MPGLELLYVLVMVIFLEGILSIDNAAVLGAMVSVLPEKEMVPWPRPLQFLALPVHRLLGGQRSAALKVGLLGAYIGRGAMLVLASYVIQNDWLKILGAVYLIKLAFENLGQEEAGEAEHVGPQGSAQKGFWSVVLTIELADLAFSIDNVVVVVALSDQLWIILFGVFMGIVTMRFAAGIFTVLIAKEPILKAAAYLVVFNIGVELLLAEFAHMEFSGPVKFMISAGTLLLAVVYAHVKPLQVVRPVLRWVAEGMGTLNELVDWLLRPITVTIGLLFRGIAAVIRMVAPRRELVIEEVKDESQEPV
jgi:tellurite resistance protein TerC